MDEFEDLTSESVLVHTNNNHNDSVEDDITKENPSLKSQEEIDKMNPIERELYNLLVIDRDNLPRYFADLEFSTSTLTLALKREPEIVILRVRNEV